LVDLQLTALAGSILKAVWGPSHLHDLATMPTTSTACPKQGRRSIYGPAADVMASIKSSNIHRFILAFWAFTWPPLQKFLIYLAPFLTFKKIFRPFCIDFTRLLSEKVK
jgi:hypothetical protein